jgi:hypothetical protein
LVSTHALIEIEPKYQNKLTFEVLGLAGYPNRTPGCRGGASPKIIIIIIIIIILKENNN